MQPHASVYNVFCRVNAIIPPTPQNSAQGFTAAFPAIVPVQPPTIPDRHNKPSHHPRNAGGHTRARTRSTETRYHHHAGTLHRSAQTVYYNKVYKRADHASGGGSAPTVCGSLASAAPGAPAEGSASPPVQGQPGGLRSVTGSAVRAHPPPGGAVKRQGRRGTIDGCRRISFRAFAR